MPDFFHIADRTHWENAQPAGSYSVESLNSEGFIHCSFPAQVLIPANERFHGRKDLLLLRIDPNLVKAEVRYDPVVLSRDGSEVEEHFPHIYGPINLDAVVAVIDFPPEWDGSFMLPAELEIDDSI